MVRTEVSLNRSRRPPTYAARNGVSIIEALYSFRAPITSHRVAGASTTIGRILLVGLCSLCSRSTFIDSFSHLLYALRC